MINQEKTLELVDRSQRKDTAAFAACATLPDRHKRPANRVKNCLFISLYINNEVKIIHNLQISCILFLLSLFHQ